MWGGVGHTVDSYSSCGRARFLYAVKFRSLLWTRMLRLRKPSLGFALLLVLLTCSDHLRSSDKVTPRYFFFLQKGHFQVHTHVGYI